MVTLSVLYLFFLSIQAQLHVIAGGWESASQNRPPFFLSQIHLVVSICGVQLWDITVFHSCGKLAEGSEESHGNDKELGKWKTNVFPGEGWGQQWHLLACHFSWHTCSHTYKWSAYIEPTVAFKFMEANVEDIFYCEMGLSFKMVT